MLEATAFCFTWAMTTSSTSSGAKPVRSIRALHTSPPISWAWVFFQRAAHAAHGSADGVYI